MKLKNKCSLLLAGVMLAGALVGCGASSAPASCRFLRAGGLLCCERGCFCLR